MSFREFHFSLTVECLTSQHHCVLLALIFFNSFQRKFMLKINELSAKCRPLSAEAETKCSYLRCPNFSTIFEIASGFENFLNTKHQHKFAVWCRKSRLKECFHKRSLCEEITLHFRLQFALFNLNFIDISLNFDTNSKYLSIQQQKTCKRHSRVKTM